MRDARKTRNEEASEQESESKSESEEEREREKEESYRSARAFFIADGLCGE